MKPAKSCLHLLLLLALALAWAPDSRAGETTVNGLTWSYDWKNGEVVITSIPRDTTGPIVIPSSLNQRSVVEIGTNAFEDCYYLTSVEIPDSVKSIGANAFENCFYLTNLSIGNSVRIIGDRAFMNCRGLTSLSIGNSVTTIGNFAFMNCQGLTSLSIGNSVTTIGNHAFLNCIGLTSLTLPDSVSTIGSWPFDQCDSLETLYLPASLEGIQLETPPTCRVFYRHLEDGWGYFTDHTQSTVTGGPTDGIVEIPSVLGGYPVVAIGEGSFCDAIGLIRVVIPDSVTTIGELAFARCSGLTSVTIGNNVTTIGDAAFAGCVNLASVEIPDSVVDISPSAFDGCNKYWAGIFRNAGGTQPQTVSLTVTNVIVHYVTASVPSAAVTPPTNSAGFVNIIAEVTAGGNAIAISPDWAEQYPAFEATFGSDFSAALTADTGKRDGAGKPVFVWQDYVAGTDPTDPSSLFTASVTYDAEGAPLVSWSPELPAEEASKRLYTIYGRVNMTDPDWTLLATDAPWHPFDPTTPTYNFYLVTVEMK